MTEVAADDNRHTTGLVQHVRHARILNGSVPPCVQVLYGMDYVSAERDEQHAYLRAALLDHLKQAGNSLLVIEEYDKLDCPTRAMFRQLFENLHAANVTGARCAGRPLGRCERGITFQRAVPQSTPG